MDSKDKSDVVKKLALDGKFNDVEERYGTKARTKAIQYAEGKLTYLKEVAATGASIETDKCATEFMLYAVKSNGSVEEASLAFLDTKCNEKNQQVLPTADPLPNKALGESIEEVAVGTEDINDKEASLSDTPALEKKAMTSKFTTPTVNSAKAKTFATPKVVGSLPSSGKLVQVSKDRAKLSTSHGNKFHVDRSHAKADPSVSTSKASKANLFPNAPKKPKNAFMLFTASIRGEILQESPGSSVTAVAKELGVRWKSMDETERSAYESLAKNDKLRYTKELLEYKELHPKEASDFEAVPKRRTSNKKSTSLPKATKIATSVTGKRSSPSTSGLQAKRRRLKKCGKSRSSSEHSEDLRASSTSSSSSSSSSSDSDDGDGMKERKRAGKKGAAADLKPATPSVMKRSGSTSPADANTKPVLLTPNIEKIVAASTVTVSSLKGIKEDHLPRSEDIRQTVTVPRKTAAFPPDFIPAVDDEVVLVLEAYKDFIAQLPSNALTEEQTEMIKEIFTHHHSSSLVTAIVLDTEEISIAQEPEVRATTSGEEGGSRSVSQSRGSDEMVLSDDEEIEIRRPKTAQTTSNDEKGPDHKHVGKEVKRTLYLMTIRVGNAACYRILYAPFSSPCLQCDIYLIARKDFSKSLKAPWLKVNAQVRRAFATSDGSGVEWVEGNIYHIREDINVNPFLAVSVVWLQLEDRPRQWFYDYSQESNECSPWDLQLSAYIGSLDQITEEASLPRELMLGPVTPNAILSYIKNMDFASVFLYKLTFNSEYCALFPNKDDRLDLHVISQRCTQGRYGDVKGDISRTSTSATKVLSKGVMQLLEDLLHMTANGKRFNDANRDFQPWRLCDMVEKNVEHLKRSLVALHGTAIGATSATTLGNQSSQFSQSSCIDRDLNSQIEGDLDEL